MPADHTDAPAPYVLALMLCDQIYRDGTTGKTSLLGLFSVLGAIDFPVKHPLLCVHLQLTDGRGETRLQVKLIDAEENREPLATADGIIEFKDPRMVLEMSFALRQITFPAPGEYRIQVYGNDQLLMERRLVVVRVEQREKS